MVITSLYCVAVFEFIRRVQNNGFYSKTLNINGRLLLIEKPLVMGILNVTPDSFYDGGKLQSEKALLDQVEKMITDGASMVDIGGHSTRPHADEVDEAEESKRVLSALKSLTAHFPQLIISVDTFRSAVARKAVEAGASLINDVSGGSMDPAMFQMVAELKVPYVLMHMRGTPQTMSQLTTYDDLIHDISIYFQERLHTLTELGVADVIIDPGFGFAKTVEQNYELLSHLDYFKIHQRPVMAGLSRKSMIWRALNTDPEGSLNGTSVMNSVALLKGADILRVHDVKEAVQCIQLLSKIQTS